jgi:hypothetical protein
VLGTGEPKRRTIWATRLAIVARLRYWDISTVYSTVGKNLAAKLCKSARRTANTEWPSLPMTCIAMQFGENARKNSFFNYESPVLPLSYSPVYADHRRNGLKIAKRSISKHRFSFQKAISLREKNRFLAKTCVFAIDEQSPRRSSTRAPDLVLNARSCYRNRLHFSQKIRPIGISRFYLRPGPGTATYYKNVTLKALLGVAPALY